MVNYSVIWHDHVCGPCGQIFLLSVMELCQLHNYSIFPCICYFHHLAVGRLGTCCKYLLRQHVPQDKLECD